MNNIVITSEETELTFEDIAFPVEIVEEPSKWAAKTYDERVSILKSVSDFLYGEPDQDSGIFNIDLNDPEVIG
jgi:hypothetical protein